VGKIKDVREVHEENALSLMLLTEVGMMMKTREVQE